MPSFRIPWWWGWGCRVFSVWKSIVVCCWPLKIGTKKIEPKGNLGPKRSIRIGSFSSPQKIVLVLVNERRYPKKIVFKPQNVRKEGQNSGTSISPNIEGAPSPGPSLSWASMICWEITNSALIFIDVVSIPIHVHSCEECKEIIDLELKTLQSGHDFQSQGRMTLKI